MLGVVTAAWVVMGFLRGKAKEGRVVRREEEEEVKVEEQLKAPEEKGEKKSEGDDVSKE